jgi:pimeloyl-ACP methyl ester carboxylesterase
MGGKVAMQFALDFPARVKKLVVVDMAPRAYRRIHDHIFDALLALDLAVFQTRQQIENALAPAIPSLNLRRFLLKNLGRDEQGKFIWKMNLRGVAENYLHLGKVLSEGKTYAGPSLFIRGGKSDYITAHDELDIRRRFSAAQIRTIATANHWVHADAPAEFLELVLDFLPDAA